MAKTRNIELYIKYKKGRLYTNKISVDLYNAITENHLLLFKIRRAANECVALLFNEKYGILDGFIIEISKLNRCFRNDYIILYESKYTGLDYQKIIESVN